MVTNFSHMKSWGNVYQKLLFLEDMLLNAKNKESYFQIMSNARVIIDMMTKELVKEAGITGERIKEVKRNKGKGETIDLYGRLLALEEYGYITKQSASNLHYLRGNGNGGLHGDEDFIGRPEEQLSAMAKKTYELLYRETYLFAMQYIPNARASRVTNGVGVAMGTTSIAKKSKVERNLATIVWIVLILILGMLYWAYGGSY